MAGPILHTEDRVPWASRPLSPIPLPAVTNVNGNLPISPPTEIVVENQNPHFIFPPEERRVGPFVFSPLPLFLDPFDMHRTTTPRPNTGLQIV